MNYTFPYLVTLSYIPYEHTVVLWAYFFDLLNLSNQVNNFIKTVLIRNIEHQYKALRLVDQISSGSVKNFVRENKIFILRQPNTSNTS